MSNEPKARIDELEAMVIEPLDCNCGECDTNDHASDCAVHNAPAYVPGPCDCGVTG